jgi:hypothetical protein
MTGCFKFYRNITFYSLLILTILVTSCSTTTLELNNSQLLSPETVLVWPPPPQTPRIRYLGSISCPADLGIKKSWIKRSVETIFGKEETEETFLRPFGVFSQADILYVTDTNGKSLHIFDIKNINYSRIFHQFASPIGVAVDSNRKIYITDSVLKRVFIYNEQGKYLGDVGSRDLFMRPTGICIDDERVYIIDTICHCVLVFNKKNYEFLFTFGSNGTQSGEFNYPVDIFLGRDNLLYITDSMNFRVQIFNREGHFLSSFGKQGDGTGDFSKMKGIAVDSEGHIYVVDADFDVVQIFDKEGRLLLVFGGRGINKGQFFLPTDIFIDEKDRIYVADSYNSRVQIFQYIKEPRRINQ